MTNTIIGIVGKETLLKVKTRNNKDKFYVRVRVLDHKFTYGRNRYLVEPVEGIGQTWCEGLDINSALK